MFINLYTWIFRCLYTFFDVKCNREILPLCLSIILIEELLSMNIVEENWEQILNKMKLEYCSSNISYNTWIAPLTVYEVTEDTVYILVKLRASLEHIEEKYRLPFRVCIGEVTGIEYEVSFVTEESDCYQGKEKISC